MKVYKIIKGAIAGVCKFLYRMKIEGAENEPAEGPLIICANHISNHDVVILGVAVKNQLRYFAKASLFKVPLLKNLITVLGAFPVDKSSANASFSAIKNSITLLRQGEVVGMFPQGHRMPGVDPRETKTMNGIGMIVYHSKCRVLPVCIQTKGWRAKFFRRTYVRIGKPIEFEEFGFTNGKSNEYNAASELIFSRITELVKD